MRHLTASRTPVSSVSVADKPSAQKALSAKQQAIPRGLSYDGHTMSNLRRGVGSNMRPAVFAVLRTCAIVFTIALLVTRIITWSHVLRINRAGPDGMIYLASEDGDLIIEQTATRWPHDDSVEHRRGVEWTCQLPSTMVPATTAALPLVGQGVDLTLCGYGLETGETHRPGFVYKRWILTLPLTVLCFLILLAWACCGARREA
jgi:hypothetical protein